MVIGDAYTWNSVYSIDPLTAHQKKKEPQEDKKRNISLSCLIRARGYRRSHVRARRGKHGPGSTGSSACINSLFFLLVFFFCVRYVCVSIHVWYTIKFNKCSSTSDHAQDSLKLASPLFVVKAHLSHMFLTFKSQYATNESKQLLTKRRVACYLGKPVPYFKTQQPGSKSRPPGTDLRIAGLCFVVAPNPSLI